MFSAGRAVRRVLRACVPALIFFVAAACAAGGTAQTDMATAPLPSKSAAPPAQGALDAAPSVNPTIYIEPSSTPMATPAEATPKPDTNAKGMPLVPDFTLGGRGGASFTLSEHEGRVVILNFFATWCPPCRQEMPDLQAFYEGIAGNPGAAFYLIDLADGQRETPEKADKYADDNGITIPLLYDTEGAAAALFGVYAIPTTVIIDKEGYLVEYIEGALSDVEYAGAPSTRRRFDDAVAEALK